MTFRCYSHAMHTESDTARGYCRVKAVEPRLKTRWIRI